MASKDRVQLDWFNVSYRSIYGVLALVLLVGGAGLGSWYYVFRYAPRAAATAAIRTAVGHLDEATEISSIEETEAMLERARVALSEAETAFAASHFQDARFAALHSADLSQQAMDRARGDDSDERLVRFYRIEGDVRVKRHGEFSWENAQDKTELGVGDQVKTSSSASAQLIYFDGTLTTVQPGSLLEIRDLYEDPVTKVRRVQEKLTWGELRASTGDQNVRGSYHEVATEKVAARSEDAGEFRMAYDRGSKTTVVDTFQGKLQVSGSGKKESLVAGERIRARSDGSLVAKESLPGIPRLVTPPDQRVFIFEDPQDQSISLRWEDVPGAQRYRLMISSRPLFTDALYDKDREGNSAVIAGVAPGAYFWRAAAINDLGARGPFSESRGFRVSSQKIRDREDTEPPELEITEFVTIGGMVVINGRSEPGVTLWIDNEKVDVYDDGRFYAVIRLRKDGHNELQFRAQDTAGNETRSVRSTYVEYF